MGAWGSAEPRSRLGQRKGREKQLRRARERLGGEGKEASVLGTLKEIELGSPPEDEAAVQDSASSSATPERMYKSEAIDVPIASASRLIHARASVQKSLRF
jgi:hypothetical protein